MTATAEATPTAAPEPAKRAGGQSRYGALARYLGVRALLIIPTAWILVTLVFFLRRGMGDPITASAGGRLTPAQIAERKAAAGFDRPLLAQYWDYLTGLFRRDFGTTLTDRRLLSHLVLVHGADVVRRLLAVLFSAAPVFFVGMLLKLLFSVKLGWLPASGRFSASPEIPLAGVRAQTHIALVA